MFAFLMSFRTSRTGWMFVVYFDCVVSSRSHFSWIGQIGEFEVFVFKSKPAYRYSTPLSTDLHLILKEHACFPYALSYQSDSVTCFLYTPGPILAELGQLVNLTVLALGENKLTGTLLSLLSLDLVNMMEEPSFPYAHSFLFWLCFVCFDCFLIVFCIH